MYVCMYVIINNVHIESTEGYLSMSDQLPCKCRLFCYLMVLLKMHTKHQLLKRVMLGITVMIIKLLGI